MKLKALALAALAIFAVGTAQASFPDDGNFTGTFTVPAREAYENAYYFTLTDITTLYVTAIARYSDSPAGNYHSITLTNFDNFDFNGYFEFSDVLTAHQFINVAAGNYLYYFTGEVRGTLPTDISFYSTSVPEPESYAMLVGGLGVLGFVARRRKTV